MPELPEARRRRFVEAYALPEYDAVQLTQSRGLADFFEDDRSRRRRAEGASNWMMGELARALKDAGRDVAESPVVPPQLAGLLTLIESGTISGAMAKGVFEKMLASGRSADEIVEAEGLAQIDDESQIEALIDEVLNGQADAVRAVPRG